MFLNYEKAVLVVCNSFTWLAHASNNNNWQTTLWMLNRFQQPSSEMLKRSLLAVRYTPSAPHWMQSERDGPNLFPKHWLLPTFWTSSWTARQDAPWWSRRTATLSSTPRRPIYASPTWPLYEGYIVLLQTEFGRTRYCIWGVRLSVCLSIMRCKFMRK